MIDTSGIDCWKVIYVRCDWVHEYKSVCDLFNECDFTRPEINRCWMIPGINPNQPGIPSAHHWYVLRVNQAGTCVEFVDPTTVFANIDEKVKASSTDPLAWYLDTKFTSSDWSVDINLIAGWSIIDLTVPTPTTPTIPDPTNACTYWAFLKAIGWAYVLECDNSALYGVRYMSNNTDMVIPAWADWIYKQILCTIFQWNWLLDYNFWGNPPVTWLKITVSWMYHVRFNAWAYIDWSVGKIRFMLWSNSTVDNPNKMLLLNSKAWVGDADWLAIVDTARWESHQYISMSEHGLMRLDAWTEITMVMRVDWLWLPAGIVKIEWGGLIEGDPSWGSDRAPPGTLALKYCGTSFGVSFHSLYKGSSL